jgi:hypothetical protein
VRARSRGINSSLELRLERLKRASDLGDEIFKNFFDRAPYGGIRVGAGGGLDWNKYRDKCGELHLHFNSIRPFCLTFRADIDPPGWDKTFPYDLDLHGEASRGERPVFVWVRQISEGWRPCASAVRLQPLDCCDMRDADAYEPDRYVPFEYLWHIVNRKLGAVLDGSAIVPRELKNEIIEGGSQIVTNLSDQNAYDRRMMLEIDRVSLSRVVRGIGIKMDFNGIKVVLPESPDMSIQLVKMFLCPVDPLKGAVEWVRHNHARIAT